jgi:predicted CoA-binding protein
VSESVQEIAERTIRMKKWAVVGASPKPARYSHKIMQLLRERGFDVYPVRPGVSEIDGLKVYPSIAAIPEQIDVVDMVVNPEVGMKAMEEIRDAGIKYVWLQPGAESEDIHAFARENGIVAIEACVLAVLAIKRDFRHG